MTIWEHSLVVLVEVFRQTDGTQVTFGRAYAGKCFRLLALRMHEYARGIKTYTKKTME
jgi:hypothetical protein